MTALGGGAVPRNAPCPCGSGRRYRDCHGALASQASPSYRPQGGDWDDVDPALHERLARLMNDALALQLAVDPAGAERHYRDVIALAPRTQDALHMLASVRWNQGEFDDAWRWMERAIAVRAPSAELVRNRDAMRRALAQVRRDQADARAEAALPGMLAALATRTAPGTPPVAGDALHLVAGTEDPDSEAAWLGARLATLLAPWRPALWVPPGVVRRPPGARILGEHGDGHPVHGVHVHVGLDAVDATGWLALATPCRVVAIGVRAMPASWLDVLPRLARDGAVTLRPVFTTTGQASHFGVAGPVLPPLDPTRLAPPPGGRPWTLGVVAGSADLLAPLGEGPLLRRIVAAGVPVAIRDPGRLRYELGALRGIRFEARGLHSLEAFVDSVDALLVPARKWHGEGLDREVALALGSARPVVVRRASIHACTVRDGIDGHVVDDDDGAFAAVEALARAPASRSEPVQAAWEAGTLPDRVAAALGLGPPEGRA